MDVATVDMSVKSRHEAFSLLLSWYKKNLMWWEGCDSLLSGELVSFKTAWSRFMKQTLFVIQCKLKPVTETINSAVKCLQRSTKKAVCPQSSIGPRAFLLSWLSPSGDLQIECRVKSLMSIFNFFETHSVRLQIFWNRSQVATAELS